MRKVIPALIGAVLLCGGLAFAYPHLAERWSAAAVPACPDVIGAERVKLPCLTRVVHGMAPPVEAAAPEPASRGER